MQSTAKLWHAAILCFALVACTSDGRQHDVVFIDAGATMSGKFLQLAIAYGLSKQGIPLPEKAAVEVVDAITKRIHGGVQISGVLSVRDDSIEFSPDRLNVLVAQGFKGFKVPIKDIINISETRVGWWDFMLLGRFDEIVLSTKHGDIRFTSRDQWITQAFNRGKAVAEVSKDIRASKVLMTQKSSRANQAASSASASKPMP